MAHLATDTSVSKMAAEVQRLQPGQPFRFCRANGEGVSKE